MRPDYPSALVFFIGGGLDIKRNPVWGRERLGACTPIIVRTLIDEARAVIVGDESSARLATLACVTRRSSAGQLFVAWLEELVSAEAGEPPELAANVSGDDLDPVGVWLCRVSFWAALFSRGCDLEPKFFQEHFRVGNSLIGAEWGPKDGMLSSRLIKDQVDPKRIELVLVVPSPSRLKEWM